MILKKLLNNNVFINRKEDTIGVTNSTKLATLTVQDYDLKFKPDVKDYTVKTAYSISELK